MTKKKIVSQKSPISSGSHLDALIESLSGSEAMKTVPETVYIMSVYLIDINDSIRKFCYINKINISHGGYMATFFKGDKEQLLRLKEYLPESQRSCTILRL